MLYLDALDGWFSGLQWFGCLLVLSFLHFSAKQGNNVVSDEF
jgi:hypothetical protein